VPCRKIKNFGVAAVGSRDLDHYTNQSIVVGTMPSTSNLPVERVEQDIRGGHRHHRYAFARYFARKRVAHLPADAHDHLAHIVAHYAIVRRDLAAAPFSFQPRFILNDFLDNRYLAVKDWI